MIKFNEFNVIEVDHPFVTEENVKWVISKIKIQNLKPSEIYDIKYVMKDFYDNYKNSFTNNNLNRNKILYDQLTKVIDNVKRYILKNRSELVSLKSVKEHYDKQRNENKNLFDYTSTAIKTSSAINKKRGKRISHMQMDW